MAVLPRSSFKKFLIAIFAIYGVASFIKTYVTEMNKTMLAFALFSIFFRVAHLLLENHNEVSKDGQSMAEDGDISSEEADATEDQKRVLLKEELEKEHLNQEDNERSLKDRRDKAKYTVGIDGQEVQASWKPLPGLKNIPGDPKEKNKATVIENGSDENNLEKTVKYTVGFDMNGGMGVRQLWQPPLGLRDFKGKTKEEQHELMEKWATRYTVFLVDEKIKEKGEKRSGKQVKGKKMKAKVKPMWIPFPLEKRKEAERKRLAMQHNECTPLVRLCRLGLLRDTINEMDKRTRSRLNRTCVSLFNICNEQGITKMELPLRLRLLWSDNATEWRVIAEYKKKYVWKDLSNIREGLLSREDFNVRVTEITVDMKETICWFGRDGNGHEWWRPSQYNYRHENLMKVLKDWRVGEVEKLTFFKCGQHLGCSCDEFTRDVQKEIKTATVMKLPLRRWEPLWH